MKKTKWKIRALKLSSFIFSLAPIATLIIINRKVYFTEVQGVVFKQGVETTIGGFMALGFAGLVAAKRTNFLKGSLGVWVITGIAFFLNAVIKDLTWILLAIATGSTLFTWHQPAIDDLKETFKYEKQANIQAKAIYNVNNNANAGAGRV